MKYVILPLLLVISLTALSTHARWVESGGDGTSQESSFSWSAWASQKASQLKEKVVTTFGAFFKTPDVASSQGSPKVADNSRGGERTPADASSSGSANSTASTSAQMSAEESAAEAPRREARTKFTAAAGQIKSMKVARVKTPAIPSKDKNLVIGRNNIPVFEFKKFKAKVLVTKIKKVPLLNVGQEAYLDEKPINFGIEKLPLIAHEPLRALVTPTLMSKAELQASLGPVVLQALPAEKVEVPFLEPDKKVTAEKIAKLIYEIKPDFAYTPLPVSKFSTEELKLLRALILFEKKDQCHVATGLFFDLLDSKDEKVHNRAQYHLGVCLHEMNLPSEAISHLTEVIKRGDSPFLKDAIKAAVEDLPPEHEGLVVEALHNIRDEMVPQDIIADVQYYRAKYYLRKKQAQKALQAALAVPEKSARYYKAQYVASIAEYEMNKIEASLARQKTMANELVRKGSNKDVLALVQVNMGRIAFQNAKFKESLEAYQRVPKEHPLWIQALTEQAWAQLQSKDAGGAIGNMHSIQSPYFEGVFKPESYIVRTIGYMNICQYADAHKALSYLEYKYWPWMEKLEAYLNQKAGNEPYATVFKHLQVKGQADVDGLPYQVVREAARQKDFLNSQESINHLIDENSGYNFIAGLIEKDKRSLISRRNATIAKVAQLKIKINKAKNTPGAMKDYNAWRFELANFEDFLNVFEFRVATLKEGAEGFVRLTAKGQSRIAQYKNRLKEQASKIVRTHFVRMLQDLKKTMESNELLKYEIYAGSGENLRYKVAGGKTGGASAKSGDRKPSGDHWEFEGEFWEDEIGNYRSSLKNNCQTVAIQPREK